jgi:FixJ family two-component response regulator
MVYIVDDDESVRRAIARFVRAAGMEAIAFASAGEFLAQPNLDQDGCLVADVKMPGVNGVELQRELKARGIQLPVILLTALDTNEVREEAKRSGAVDYLRKPVDGQALIDAILWALSGKQSP